MKLRALLIFALIATAFACGESDPKVDGWKLGGDTGVDAGSDTGSDTGNPDSGRPDGGTDMGNDVGTDAGQPPGSVTFRLTNAGNAPVFAYSSVAGGISCFSGAWLEILEDGASRRIGSDCTRCSCDDAPNCTVCALDCAPGADPSYAQLDVGADRTFEWDGLLRVDDTKGGVQCESLRPPQSDNLTARFCWGYSFAPVSGPFGEITDVQCADVEFSTSDGLVEHRIEATARDHVDFQLTNASTNVVYANLSVSGPCSFGTWLHLDQNGQELDLSNECGECRCSQVDDANATCMQPCPAIACAAPTKELFELAPGAQRMHSWDRTAFYPDEVNGMACETGRLVTGNVTARMCWGSDITDGYQLVNETCAMVDFDPQTTTIVSHEIP